MSRLNINNLTNENEDGSPKISGISTFSSTAFLETPKGTTAERPSHADAGMIRFNTDSGHLEYYNGVEWTSVAVNNNKLDGGNRGIFGGGYAPSPVFGSNEIDYITISTLGNAVDFGTFTGRYGLGSCSSSTRGLFAGGQLNPGSLTNAIQFITISSTGNGATFGNLNAATRHNVQAATSSETRGLFMGGFESPLVVNTIDYVTIASTGNAQDFGDLTGIVQAASATSSPTRAVKFGGGSPTRQSTIDFVTISTLGNALNFGTLSEIRWFGAACSNSTRGLNAGNNPATNTIDFITFATLGSRQDFGDLNGALQNLAGCSSPTRGVFGGGFESPSVVNRIDYVTIATTGNAQDFGDLTSTRFNLGAACSNGHGGL